MKAESKLNLKRRTERTLNPFLFLSLFLRSLLVFSYLLGCLWVRSTRVTARKAPDKDWAARRSVAKTLLWTWMHERIDLPGTSKFYAEKRMQRRKPRHYLCLRIFWFLPSKGIGVPAPEALDEYEGGLYGRGQPWTTGGDDTGAYCSRGLVGTPGCINLISPAAFQVDDD